MIDAEENEASASGGREDKTDEPACVALVQRCSEFDQATITVIVCVCVEKKGKERKEIRESANLCKLSVLSIRFSNSRCSKRPI